ncbi:MAG: sigma-70 family RNA polymerase sigma factor [Thermodesulfobacteriota bacterium]
MSPNSTAEPGSNKERDLRWKNLISRIADGDENALSDLYDDSIKLTYSLAMQILSNAHEAEEVALDVYKYVWKNASNYDPGRSNPATWLVMLTRSRAIDKLRSSNIPIKLSKTFEEELIRTEINPEDTVMGIEQRKFIQEALLELNPKQRKVIELVYFYQFRQSEIANMLDIPIGSVKSTIRLAKEKLSSTLRLLRPDS